MGFLFQQDDRAQYRLGVILAVGAVLWGGTYNALAKGLTPLLSPTSLLILSETLTAAFIIVTFGLVPLVKKLAAMDARSIRMAILVGLLTSAVAPYLFFVGLAKTSAINATMLSSADIIFTVLIASVLLRERLTRMQGMGVAVVCIGIVIINVSALRESVSVNVGDLYILLATAAGSLGAVLFKQHLSHVMPELAIVIRNVAGILAVALLSSMFQQQSLSAEIVAFPISKILLLIAFTFFSRYLNLVFFYESVDRLPVTTCSLISTGTPLAGLLFAFLILGEQIHSYQILGWIFIVFGLVLEQFSENAVTRIRHGWSLLHLRPMSAERAQVVGMVGRNL